MPILTGYSDIRPSAAGKAFLAAKGPRYLCGSCHARKRRAGDWLCRKCRAELCEDLRPLHRLAAEPLDWEAERRQTHTKQHELVCEPKPPVPVIQYGVLRWEPDGVILIRMIEQRAA